MSNRKKSKVLAIILSLLVGIFAWCYTWKLDQWKFWTALVLALCSVGFLGIPVTLWVIIDMIIKPEEDFTNYYEDKK